jgi:hypothetical protein
MLLKNSSAKNKLLRIHNTILINMHILFESLIDTVNIKKKHGKITAACPVVQVA